MNSYHGDADKVLKALVNFLRQQDFSKHIEISFSVQDLGIFMLSEVQPAISALRMLVSLRVLCSGPRRHTVGRRVTFSITKFRAQRLIDFMDKSGGTGKNDPLIWEI